MQSFLMYYRMGILFIEMLLFHLDESVENLRK